MDTVTTYNTTQMRGRRRPNAGGRCVRQKAHTHMPGRPDRQTHHNSSLCCQRGAGQRTLVETARPNGKSEVDRGSTIGSGECRATRQQGCGSAGGLCSVLYTPQQGCDISNHNRSGPPMGVQRVHMRRPPELVEPATYGPLRPRAANGKQRPA